MIILFDVDEMIPDKCSDCRFCVRARVRARTKETFVRSCVALGETVSNVSGRLKACPVKNMPGRFEPSSGPCSEPREAYKNGLNDGWNSCVDAIEKD